MRLRSGIGFALGALSSLALIAIACGIEEGGVVDGVNSEGGGPDTSTITDGAAPIKDVVVVDTYLPPSCGDAAGCLPPVPAGWQILSLLADPDAGCPQAFNQADLQTNPVFDPGACGCSCADQSDAGCPQQVTLDYTAKSAFCYVNPTTVTLDAGCTAIGANNIDNPGFGIKQIPVTGLACGAPQQTGSQNGKVTPVRVCQPTCAADYCGSLTGGTKGCVMFNGDAPACPTGYATKLTVGNQIDFFCNGCPGCTAKANLNCTVTSDLHQAGDCNDNSAFSIPTNGSCKQWLGNNKNWGSVSMTITPPAGPFCSYSTVDPGGDAGYQGTRTICCK
jgi:hypothetical protein